MGQYQPASQGPTGRARPEVLQYWPAVQSVGSGEANGQKVPAWHSPPVVGSDGWKYDYNLISFLKIGSGKNVHNHVLFNMVQTLTKR